MSSLTPAHRNQEATAVAMHEGLISGGLALLPSCGALYIAMQNKTFLARTNWQSRTALAIMPALFFFTWTAEHSLTNKMREIAKETQHSSATVEWAETELQKHLTNNKEILKQNESEAHVMAMYQKSVYEDSGVCIVPGDRLGLHHKMANYVNANPIKFLACLAVPSVAWIFYGNTGKQHLKFSVKLLHTRVFGQFATISCKLLLPAAGMTFLRCGSRFGMVSLTLLFFNLLFFS
jgi:hypothetical protein